MVGAKAYLRQVKLFDTHINNKLSELATLREMTTKITATLKADVVSGGGGSQDKLGDVVAKIVDLKAEINRAVDEYVDKKKEVSAVIEQIQDPDQVAVLHKRYFQDEPWEQIACDLHCTFRNVCYIHGKALQTVEELLVKGTENG